MREAIRATQCIWSDSHFRGILTPLDNGADIGSADHASATPAISRGYMA